MTSNFGLQTNLPTLSQNIPYVCRVRKEILASRKVRKMPAVCRFKFPEGLDRESIEAKLALAIVATECIFGQAKVRTSAAYYISEVSTGQEEQPKGLQAAIDVSTEVGEHVANVFTGLMIRQLGEDKFTVDRVNSEKEPSSNERC
jgi:hypothetical protein